AIVLLAKAPARRERLRRRGTAGAARCAPAAAARAWEPTCSRRAGGRGQSLCASAELLPEQRVEDAGISLAFELLHRLADEEPEQVGLAAFVLLHFSRVPRDHGVDHGLDRALSGDLGEALPFDDPLGRLPGPDQLGKNLFRRRRVDRASVLQLP